VDEDLEPGRVARQLEQPHDANDAEELENVSRPPDVLRRPHQRPVARRGHIVYLLTYSGSPPLN